MCFAWAVACNVYCSFGCHAGSLKGFGFATFMTRGHAESAIKNTNGKVTHLGSTHKHHLYNLPHLVCDLLCHTLRDGYCAVMHAPDFMGSMLRNSIQLHCLQLLVTGGGRQAGCGGLGNGQSTLHGRICTALRSVPVCTHCCHVWQAMQIF